MRDMIFKLLRVCTLDYYPFRHSVHALPVIIFHRVNDEPHTYYRGVPVAVFEAICTFLNKHYEIIHFADIESYYASSPSRPAAVITFDDGHYDILQHAYPILKRLNLKFNINIDTEILETGQPQYFVRVYDILNHARISTYYQPHYMTAPITIDAARPMEAEAAFTALLYPMNTADKRAFLAQMERDTAMPTTAYSRMLSATEIKQLYDSGLVEVGSHTHTHPILTQISATEMEYELSHSKSVLEKIIGKPIDIIAYPNGVFNQAVEDTARALGYKYLLITLDGINQFSPTLLSTRRYERVNQYHNSAEIALAHTYGITQRILKLMGK